MPINYSTLERYSEDEASDGAFEPIANSEFHPGEISPTGRYRVVLEPLAESPPNAWDAPQQIVIFDDHSDEKRIFEREIARTEPFISMSGYSSDEKYLFISLTASSEPLTSFFAINLENGSFIEGFDEHGGPENITLFGEQRYVLLNKSDFGQGDALHLSNYSATNAYVLDMQLGAITWITADNLGQDLGAIWNSSPRISIDENAIAYTSGESAFHMVGLDATNNADFLQSFGGETIDGLEGDDIIHGNIGPDHLIGGEGNDHLIGDEVIQPPFGMSVASTIAVDSADIMDGGPGDDVIEGGDGNDTLNGGEGNDRLSGGPGDDQLVGGPGDDIVLGEDGNDELSGNGGSDVVRGGRGDDRLKGRGGDDELFGGRGDDTLIGGEGDDTLNGGPGADRFDLLGDDTISDFDVTRDSLLLDQTPFALAEADSNRDGAIDADDDGVDVEDGNLSIMLAGASVTLLGLSSLALANAWPLAEDDGYATDEDTALTGDVLANDSDADGNDLEAALMETTSNGALTLSPDGTFTYEPNTDFAGTDSFTYTLRDPAGGTDDALVTITVVAVNDAPVAEDDAATTDEDTAVEIDILANDKDVERDAQLSITSDPSNGTAEIVDDRIVYTPATDFNGADSLGYTLDDGDVSAAATVSITVAATNDGPSASDDTATIEEDGSVLIDVLANDNDIDGDPLAIEAFEAETANGRVESDDGGLRYQPNADFFGDDSFTYTVSDGNGGTDEAAVSVSVTAVNDRPVANDDTATVEEGRSIRIDVLANDSDADGDALSVALTESADGGELQLNADGSFTYTPNAGFLGDDRFEYVASDGIGGPGRAAVTVTVTEAQDDSEPGNGGGAGPDDPGNDDSLELSGGSDGDNLVGAAGNDLIDGAGGPDRLEGQAGNDRLMGGDGSDELFGGAGNDRLGGGRGADLIQGGSGDDRLWGNEGADVLRGGAGNDDVQGGKWDDRCEGGRGFDELRGFSGDDRLFGNQGGDDLYGGGGSDRLEGGAWRDGLRGGSGDDLLRGGAGDDRLWGNQGDDALFGGGGDDRLSGGAGADSLNGGAGDDLLSGGVGADAFIYAAGADVDTITDFEAGDVLRLRGFGDLTAREVVDAAEIVGGDTLIDLDGGGTDLVLLGYSNLEVGDLVL